MNVNSILRLLFRPGSSGGPAVATFIESDQPIRLPPIVEPDDLPPEFEDVVRVQVLGYREELKFVDEHRTRVLDPIWTLVPKDR